MNFQGLPIMAYHGCDASVATDVVNGKLVMKNSTNVYDWLGAGIYFWVGSFNRAQAWAHESFMKGKISSPDVVCAIVDLKNCLALTDFGMSDILQVAHSHLEALTRATGGIMPINTFTRRELDRAVIDTVHFLRQHLGASAFDTVLGAFEEGHSVFPNSRIKAKSHIQIAVRTPSCILKTFRI